jgi:hypothetical protein
MMLHSDKKRQKAKFEYTLQFFSMHGADVKETYRRPTKEDQIDEQAELSQGVHPSLV